MIVVWIKMGAKYCREHAKTKRRFDWFQIVLSVDIFNCFSWAKKTPLTILSLKNNSWKISLALFRVTQRAVFYRTLIKNDLFYRWFKHVIWEQRLLLSKLFSLFSAQHLAYVIPYSVWRIYWVSDFICSMFHCTSSLSLC